MSIIQAYLYAGRKFHNKILSDFEDKNLSEMQKADKNWIRSYMQELSDYEAEIKAKRERKKREGKDKARKQY